MTNATILKDAILSAFPLIQECLIDWSEDALVRNVDKHRVLVNALLYRAVRKYNQCFFDFLKERGYTPCTEALDIPGFDGSKVPGFELWINNSALDTEVGEVTRDENYLKIQRLVGSLSKYCPPTKWIGKGEPFTAANSPTAPFIIPYGSRVLIALNAIKFAYPEVNMTDLLKMKGWYEDAFIPPPQDLFATHKVFSSFNF
jgi:hypothetical protein